MSTIARWAKALELSRRAVDLTLPGLIDTLAEQYGDRAALIGETQTLTYRDLARRMNRYARWFLPLTGQTIGLLMPNSPEYVVIWLALSRIGCKVALLNTNLQGDALHHCITVAGITQLIGYAPVEGVININATALAEAENDTSPVALPIPVPSDVALLIYTSGTTGLPKAANITHRRIIEWSFWFAGMMNATPDDRLYNCLPMYHSVGGVVGIGSMLVSGGSVVVRPRFSASRFWHDVRQQRCTIFLYIGELCRYLTALPPDANDGLHCLRLAVGNGLRADVWDVFAQRFSIPQILEYYAATEGVVSLYNCEGMPGSIGRIPPILAAYFAVQLIRVDFESGEPVRNAAGYCVQCAPDEPGEAIGLLRAERSFDGYQDIKATTHKVLNDVFAPGDRWYRTHDLMRRDAAGFFYFVDRLGDTFRWKGENVSTTEVASVIGCCPGVLDAIVYGVEMPGQEGRAGMAAIVTTDTFTFPALAAQLQKLPSYARPIFVRCCRSLDVTGTFKLAKTRFIAENYRLATDPIWMALDGTFVPYNSRG